jgi:hypothetical protein
VLINIGGQLLLASVPIEPAAIIEAGKDYPYLKYTQKFFFNFNVKALDGSTELVKDTIIFVNA